MNLLTEAFGATSTCVGGGWADWTLSVAALTVVWFKIMPLWLTIWVPEAAAATGVGWILLTEGETTVVIDGLRVWICLRTCAVVPKFKKKIQIRFKLFEKCEIDNKIIHLPCGKSSIPWVAVATIGVGGVGVGGGVGIFCTSKM